MLVVATLTSYGLRADGIAGRGAGLATLALACFKGRLVILDFMELRHAPRIWRGMIEGWALLISGLIFFFMHVAWVHFDLRECSVGHGPSSIPRGQTQDGAYPSQLCPIAAKTT